MREASFCFCFRRLVVVVSFTFVSVYKSTPRFGQLPAGTQVEKINRSGDGPNSTTTTTTNIMIDDSTTTAAEAENTTSMKTTPGQTLIVPNVLLAGVQKGGTTAVSYYLFNKYGVCHAKALAGEPSYFEKEVHFFDSKRYNRGLEYYAEHFDHCLVDDRGSNSSASTATSFSMPPLVMDGTPSNQIESKRTQEFYQTNNHNSKLAYGGIADNLKVMMILREPTGRELSWYNHKTFQYLLDPNPKAFWYDVANITASKDHSTVVPPVYSFDEYVDNVLLPKLGRKNPSARGFYAAHLRKWFQWVPRDRILILSQEELVQDPNTFMGRVEAFLGLERKAKEEGMGHSNTHESPQKVRYPSCVSQQKLSKLFAPKNEELYALLEANPGPPMEQVPFPKFQLGRCEE